MLLVSCLVCALLPPAVALLQPTEIPPLLDSPVFALATQNADAISSPPSSSTNMNLMTYATPVAVQPQRIWCLGLYKDTLSYENFARTGTGILQLLPDDDRHISLVRLLGGASGRDTDKQAACAALGCAWVDLDDDDDDDDHGTIQVLPDCVSYVKLSLMGPPLVDAGSHAVAICRVDATYDDPTKGTKEKKHLSTAKLRELGIITEQGRVA